MTPTREFVLRLSCRDQEGIVDAVSGLHYQASCDIINRGVKLIGATAHHVTAELDVEHRVLGNGHKTVVFK